MSPPDATGRSGVLARWVATMALATLGGGLATLVGMPAGWMSGAAIAVAIAALARRRVVFPKSAEAPTYVVLGAAMGSTVTADTLSGAENLPLSLAALLASIALITAGGFFVLRVLAGWSRSTAFLSAVPGALAYCIAIANERSDADTPRVALSQTSRLMVLVVVVPAIVELSATTPSDPQRVTHLLMPLHLLVLLAACALGSWVAHRLRLPAAHLTGPFFVSLGLHLAGLSVAHVPTWMMLPAYVLMGANIGVRFGKADAMAMLRSVGPVLLAFALALTLAFVVAAAYSALTGVGLVQAFLAFAPGGIDAMAVLALALQLDTAFVVIHQVIRFLLLMLLVPLMTTFVLGRLDPKKVERD